MTFAFYLFSFYAVRLNIFTTKIHAPCQICPPSASRAYQKRWATARGNHSLDAYLREGGEGEERKNHSSDLFICLSKISPSFH